MNTANWNQKILYKLKIIGINKTNSRSYKTKKIHNKIKFKLIWIFNVSKALKPHS